MDNNPLPDNPQVVCPACGGRGTTKPEEYKLPDTDMVYAIGLVDNCPTCGGNKTISLEEYQRLQTPRI